MDEIGSRIKALRKEHGLTQAEFAARFGADRATVTSYELGRRVPSEIAVRAIVNAFGVSEAWLRDGSGSMLAESRSSLDELARAMELDDIEVALLKGFMSLSPASRSDFIEMLERVLLREGLGPVPETIRSAAPDLKASPPRSAPRMAAYEGDVDPADEAAVLKARDEHRKRGQ